MSKKKKKKAAPVRKAAKKAKKPAPRALGLMSAVEAAAPSQRTAAATIFIYKVDGATRVRTSPQMLSTGRGHIEWTVVNLASNEPVEVEITWKAESPWGGKDPVRINNGNCRKSLAGARDGNYKYFVTADGYTEDPELEIPGV